MVSGWRPPSNQNEWPTAAGMDGGTLARIVERSAMHMNLREQNNRIDPNLNSRFKLDRRWDAGISALAEKLPSHFIDLIQDTALKSFWRKASLINFLRRHNISQTFLATMNPAETKRDLLGRLFPRLEASEKGVRVFKQMAISLADQVTFPDLQGWEDSEQKITTTKDAVSSLKRYLEIHRQKAEELREREAVKKVGRERAQKAVNQAQISKNSKTFGSDFQGPWDAIGRL
jgi:hypothetical protein